MIKFPDEIHQSCMYSLYSVSLAKSMYLPFTNPIYPSAVVYPFISDTSMIFLSVFWTEYTLQHWMSYKTDFSFFSVKIMLRFTRPPANADFCAKCRKIFFCFTLLPHPYVDNFRLYACLHSLIWPSPWFSLHLPHISWFSASFLPGYTHSFFLIQPFFTVILPAPHASPPPLCG